uniref:Uncharacterized protein n=1 Tax=Timema cristinae TaxID=61476 RepID=A0A7R9CWW0_TIMCR|nr:unnamed protein product [Timema cristinae]
MTLYHDLLACAALYYLVFETEMVQYNIKKKEEIQEMMPQEEPNPLMRKKKTPEELAREAEAEEEDEFTNDDHKALFFSCSKYPSNESPQSFYLRRSDAHSWAFILSRPA